MKFLKTLLLALLLALSAAAQVTSAQKEVQHSAAVTIVMVNDKEHVGAGCSATAIAPHVLLTAQHCDVDGGVLYLNQNVKPYQHALTVSEKYYDNNDHMLLVVPGVEFKHTIVYDANKVREIKQGEHLYLWGNPALVMDQYREVYATGTYPYNESNEEINAGGKFEIVSGPVVGGDSGSAIFSSEDGQLVGVTTYGLAGGLFLGSYPLHFTQAQIELAEGIGNFVYLPDARPRIDVVVNSPENKSSDRMSSDVSALVSLFGIFLFMFVLPMAYKTTRAILVFIGWKPLLYVGRLLKKIGKSLYNATVELKKV